MTPRWPVVLFDFDGTLADTIPLIVASYHHAIGTLGEVADEAEVLSWIGRPLQPVLEERYPGRGAELTAVYRRWNLAHHDDLIRDVQGMPELLAELHDRGARTGVVSSKKAETVRLGLRAVGLDEVIDVVAGQDETDHHKPHPAPLLYAAERLEVSVTECVYVGDATVDVQAARAAGMGAVAVTWGAGDEAALAAVGPDAVVADVAGLRGALLAPVGGRGVVGR
ncbi:HAD-IA family hydrolase [Phycicoccus sp. M110.8]|uniref:HAD family hydrolase n=1 Tax=Phycicoccus sp. M110.8 TaxID=3075433 RepID=UPI0028FD13D7|nr:HAD-IA family hydrolase [Phycicoccus sp. M110.8]MDU0313268.1 HAD-IA family hydrolase [Phycicoccus sp. M110.8]HET8765884.1 HAD-IA family hydrolase [Pedococcus sp.]